MIQTATGADVDRLLNQILARPERYAEVVICSPFIDDDMQRRLVRLAEAARRVQCGMRIITTPHAAANLRASLPGHAAVWKGAILARRGLHAKIYLAIARFRSESEVIVTSANLTSAGLDTNIELGIRARPSTDPGRDLLSQVRHFVQRLAAA